MAWQVQVSGGEGMVVKVHDPRTYCLFTVGVLNPCLSYLSKVMYVSLRPPTSVQDNCLPVHRLHRGTGGPGRQRHPRHH